jgi:hypothetical protein
VASFGLAHGGDISLLGVGATLKGHFPIASMELRPGLMVSYQFSDFDNLSETVQGIGVSAFVEAAFPIASRLNALVHLSLTSQVVGGNSAVDVTWGMLYLTGGIELAL